MTADSKILEGALRSLRSSWLTFFPQVLLYGEEALSKKRFGPRLDKFLAAAAVAGPLF